MEATGVIRRLDELGRVTIPREIINSLGLKVKSSGKKDGSPLEILVEGEQIVLRKYNPGCILCGGLDDVHNVDGVKICKSCAEKIAKVVK